MKRVASFLAALTVLSAPGAYAKAASPHCMTRRVVIRSDDNAIRLAEEGGVNAAQFTAWLQKAKPTAHAALRRMRPGDVFVMCAAPSGTGDDSVFDIHVERDENGRKLAEQIGALPQIRPQFARVIGSVVTTRLPASQPSASDQTPPSHVNTAAAETNKAAMDLLITELTPGGSLNQELSRRLGHHPVAAAAMDYAMRVWHLPARLPKDSHCTIALLPRHESDPGMQLAYIQFDYHGHEQRLYHYVDSLGRDFMVNAHGQSYWILDPLPPVSNAHISSGWGWRIQPVLGGNEFHQGIDYAAPNGTPVLSTMDGVVDISEWRGNYGRLVEIRHTQDLSTRYGHLSAFASDVRTGTHVHRGQVIGYVGTSGLSTGPHLYYEIWDHGQRVDPLEDKRLMVTTSLSPSERRRFSDYVSRMAAP
jgi:murein DD-endopeptidase MepM/ murein hydrolase activator NlpD